jgi:ribonucleoside-diphosphate reductase alpha chain
VAGKSLCPECGEPLVFEGGCNICKNCGWSKCL